MRRPGCSWSSSATTGCTLPQTCRLGYLTRPPFHRAASGGEVQSTRTWTTGVCVRTAPGAAARFRWRSICMKSQEEFARLGWALAISGVLATVAAVSSRLDGASGDATIGRGARSAASLRDGCEPRIAHAAHVVEHPRPDARRALPTASGAQSGATPGDVAAAVEEHQMAHTPLEVEHLLI